MTADVAPRIAEPNEPLVQWSVPRAAGGVPYVSRRVPAMSILTATLSPQHSDSTKSEGIHGRQPRGRSRSPDVL